MHNTEFLHYGIIGSLVIANSFGVGIGQGITSYSAINAINRQPASRSDVTRIALIGMTLIETVAILALLVAVLLIINVQDITPYTTYAELGIAAAICITGFVVGLASAKPAQAACNAAAKQPLFTQKIFNFMLMTQVLIQTPVIAGLLVALFIQGQSISIEHLSDSMRLIASGLCIGLGSIGPAIGLSIFSQAAIDGIGRNTKAYNKLLSFTFVSEAIIETPIIFCLVIAITLLFIITPLKTDNFLDSIIFIAAALCIGLGTLGPGLSSGKTGAAACSQIADNPENYTILSRTSMLAQGIIETVVIYALLLSLLMLLLK